MAKAFQPKRRALLATGPILLLAACGRTTRSGDAGSGIPTNWPLEQQQLLREYDLIVAALRNRYIEPDKVGAAWQAKAADVRGKFTSSTSSESYIRLLGEVIEPLNDPELTLSTPPAPASSTARGTSTPAFSGLGVQVDPPSKGKPRVLILGTYESGPARIAGLRTGDSITAVDGVAIGENDPGVFERLRGPAGSTARITVRSPGQTPRLVNVTRAPISGDIPTESRFITGTGIGHVLPSRSMSGDAVLVSIVNTLRTLNSQRALDGLILDLRTMSSLDFPMPEVLELFAFGDVAVMRDRNNLVPALPWNRGSSGQRLTLSGRNIAGSQTMPLAVLVGEFTQGPAEALAGLLQALAGRATVIGSKTRGQTSVTVEQRLPTSGLILRIPNSEYQTLAGKGWRGQGVQPILEGATAFEDTVPERDPYIAAALGKFGIR